MDKITTALFDFDGTLVDTEWQYDRFWNRKAEEFRLGIPDFATKIKGTIMPDILQKYFSAYPENVRKQLIDDIYAFDDQLEFPPIPGALEFLRMLKNAGYRLGLVTSSDNRKIRRAFGILPFEGLFDTVITADRITKGKPDPMCYLSAASDLGVSPEACIVFEDALAGIRAGVDAGMRVIGLSTTNPAETLRDKVYAVIPDFRGLTLENFRKWC